MKFSTIKKLALTTFAASMISSAALAGGHNGDEASTVSCRVLDTKGVELPATVAVTDDGLVQRITGSSSTFNYRVELSDAVARLKLTDLRSGDKVTLREGDLDIDEVVAVTLETDEAPASALSLECTGK